MDQSPAGWPLDAFFSDPDQHGPNVRQRARTARAEAHEVCAKAEALCTAIRSMPRRMRGKMIGGSAGSADSEPATCSRIRDLIDAGRLPAHPPTMIWAGPSTGTRSCGVCCETLVAGDVEYEVVIGTATMFMHIRCVKLWATEAERRLDVADGIRAKIELGELPSRRPDAISIGSGNGEDCSACGQPILSKDVLYEFKEADRRFRLHEKCLRMWHEQRGQLGLT
jgi:hypothetical protein